MAERFPAAAAEEGERKSEVKCPLCHRLYQDSKAAGWHLRLKHKDAPELDKLLKALPKDVCPYCGKSKGNVVQHKRTCSQNPAKRRAPEPEPEAATEVPLALADPYAGLSNDDFFARFKQRMLRRRLMVEVSAEQYLRHVKSFVGHETSLDPQFVAWQWFRVGTKQDR